MDNIKNNLFIKYSATRTVFLDKSNESKLIRFRLFYKKIYKKYFINIHKDARILDLGCNRGYLLKILHENNFSNLTGVDLSKNDLDVARSLSPTINFIKKDIFEFLKNIKFKYDVIFMRAVIEHIEKDRIIFLLNLIRSALNPSGFALIDTDNADWLFSHHDRYMDFTHEVGFTIESLRQVGLMVFENIYIETYPNPIVFESKYYVIKKIRFMMYCFFRFFVKKIISFIEPEMKNSPLLDRYIFIKLMN